MSMSAAFAVAMLAPAPAPRSEIRQPPIDVPAASTGMRRTVAEPVEGKRRAGTASTTPTVAATTQSGAQSTSSPTAPPPSTDAAPSTAATPALDAAPSTAAAPALQVSPPPETGGSPQASTAPQGQPDAATAAPPVQGDVVVTARRGGDPLRAVNERTFAATQAVDEAITGPAALAYKRVVPNPVRSGLRNFFNNLHEPNVAVNYLLQLKPGKAAETLGRFALNTTLGVAGLFDVAKRRPFRLPRRPNGFADTLGYYGVRPGAYFFLPLIGPTTLRDFIGGGVDRLLSVSYLNGPFGGRAYVLSTAAVRILDRRAESDDRVRTVRESADPYETRRTLYMRKREAEIERLHGRRPVAPDPVAPPAPTGAPPTAAPTPTSDPAAPIPPSSGSAAPEPHPIAMPAAGGPTPHVDGRASAPDTARP